MQELGRRAGVALPKSPPKAELAKKFAESGRVSFRGLLEQMQRDELRTACREHGLDDSGRARQLLMSRLLEAHGDMKSVPPAPLFSASLSGGHMPKSGDTVVARHRQWLVDDVEPPPAEGQATLVTLTCLDDDHRGEVTQLFWELELGAKVINPSADAFSEAAEFDDPGNFLAHLSAIRWQGVTATRADRFQSPFRAGIHMQAHQLIPLQKALSLPRANLFIADDVGLGKTIEAGLVLQELILRQRVNFALIVCPASVTLQWQAEMEQRFGLRFEVYSRDFVVARQRERGFGINPWSTHNRFIISYPLLRRPEYRDRLLEHLRTLSLEQSGDRARRSMLIMDEAHTAAPASASRYAVDSKITTVVRDIAPRFENRLFLSATPHNGHSNSFSALLEILDPQRFTRGVSVSGPDALEPVMVRRLKRDLRGVTGELSFPERKVIRLTLSTPDPAANEPAWNLVPVVSSSDGADEQGQASSLGSGATNELGLASLLSRYSALASEGGKGRRLTFINLQKRLLSSPEAFYRTLERHAHALGKKHKPHPHHTPSGPTVDPLMEERGELGADSAYGVDDETLDAAEDAMVETESHAMDPAVEARAVLEELREKGRAARRQPDAKLLAFAQWLREHCCAGVSLDPSSTKGSAGSNKEKKWSDRRVIIFTEYSDTRKYLRDLLSSAIEGTDQADERIVQLHGGMGEESRDEVQYRFNADPDKEPARILIATDAAREGLNLQAYCADLFHWDVPWNPSRMEQRNGRIDRALQPSDEVRCHYFAYAQREEDRVLETLVRKAEIIHRELGSMGDVLAERIEDVLKRGIDEETESAIESAQASLLGERHETSERELEALRSSKEAEERIKREMEAATKTYVASKDIVGFEHEQLQHTLDVALLQICGRGFIPLPDAMSQAEGERDVVDPHRSFGRSDPAKSQRFSVPELPEDWAKTLDALRPPRGRDEHFFDWRKKAPRPVVFKPPKTMTSEVVQLHLEHPFVKRLLSRFTAQGFAHHVISGLTVLPAAKISVPHALAIGRLSLFGSGAGRLHDELLYASASIETGTVSGVGLNDKLITALEEHLKTPHVAPKPPMSLLADFRSVLPSAASVLWKALREEADAASARAEELLRSRGAEESRQLQQIIQKQIDLIRTKLGETEQHSFDFGDSRSEREQAAQLERDVRHMKRRLEGLEQEKEFEPAQIQALYERKLRRFEPVGLVFFTPEVG